MRGMIEAYFLKVEVNEVGANCIRGRPKSSEEERKNDAFVKIYRAVLRMEATIATLHQQVLQTALRS